MTITYFGNQCAGTEYTYSTRSGKSVGSKPCYSLRREPSARRTPVDPDVLGRVVTLQQLLIDRSDVFAGGWKPVLRPLPVVDGNHLNGSKTGNGNGLRLTAQN